MSGISESNIDEQVRGLSSALEELGVFIRSSCGGHPNPEKGQCGEGEFYIAFSVPRNNHGWRIMDQIVGVVQQAAEKSGDPSKYMVMIWADEATLFEIHGCEGADPDVITRMLEA
jgi:hypothetical protein